jgi:hypothetical protein
MHEIVNGFKLKTVISTKGLPARLAEASAKRAGKAGRNLQINVCLEISRYARNDRTALKIALP